MPDERTVDTGIIGHAAAGLMELVEQEHGAHELVDVFIVAEVDCCEYTAYRWKGSSDRASINAGLCAQALEGLTEGRRTDEDE